MAQGQMSDETKKAYTDALKVFDKNNDGKISTSEIRQVFQELNNPVTEGYAEEMKLKYDKDGNGFIDLNEFAQIMHDYDLKLKTTFDVFDKDGNGFITVDELGDLFKKIGRTDVTAQQVQQAVAEADLNKDGKVSFEEFKKMYGKTGVN